MRPKEKIAVTIPLPSAAVKRIDAAEKARQLVAGAPGAEPPAAGDLVKLTTRIFSEQLAWMKEEIARHHARNPRSPKLTLEELTQIALDHLRKVKNLDALVVRYRS